MIHQKVGFIGFGNMSQSIIHRLLDQSVLKPNKISVTNRSEGKLKKAEELGLSVYKNNEELIENSDIVFLGVKPQDLLETLEAVESSFTEDQIVISLAAGISLSDLEKNISEACRLVRIMPNTPIQLGKGVIGYCLGKGAESTETTILDLLEPLGLAVKTEEGDLFQALTVACGSGTGFVFELMEYWQEWLESYGYSTKTARQMTVQTFFGAAALAQDKADIPVSELKTRVVSKKGVTHAGLESMQELEIERALRYSFEKAVLRDRELGKS